MFHLVVPLTFDRSILIQANTVYKKILTYTFLQNLPGLSMLKQALFTSQKFLEFLHIYLNLKSKNRQFEQRLRNNYLFLQIHLNLNVFISMVDEVWEVLISFPWTFHLFVRCFTVTITWMLSVPSSFLHEWNK